MTLVPLLEIDPTSFNLFVSREEALSETYLYLFEKKKKKKKEKKKIHLLLEK